MKAKSFITLACCATTWITALSTFATEPAETTPSPSELTTSHARELFQQANALYEENNYALAYTLYKAAWELRPHYRIAANLGNCEYSLGKYRDAAEHLAISLRGHPPDAMAADLAYVRELHAKALQHVAILNVQLLNAGAADVFVDDRNVGRAPMINDIAIEPGKHIIHARNDIASGHVAVDVKAGEIKRISLTILPPTKIIEIVPEPSQAPPAVYGVGTGLVAVLLAGGITFAAIAQRQERHVEPAASDSIANNYLLSRAFLIAAGGAGIATTTTLLAVMPEKPSQQRVTAAIAPQSGGLVVGIGITL